MRRMLTVVALGGLAWWGYGQWIGDANAAGGDGSENGGPGAGAPLDAGGLDGLQDPPLTADGREPAPASGGSRDDKIARFARSLRNGDAKALKHGFEVYQKARSAENRRQLGAALESVVGDASTAESAAVALGDSNAFLHTELGRNLLVGVLDRIKGEKPADALRLSQKILEAGMNGAIQLGDLEARQAFETAYGKHRNLVRRVVFDPGNAARARRYEVASGDSLDKIAKRFRKAGTKISSGTLQVVNRIDNPNTLQIGQKLRVPIDPVRCVVHKESYALATYIGPDLVRVYWIAHGKEGHETPETTFVVGETISNPDWHHGGRVIAFGDPENPLGKYFVKFSHESYSGFGAHGTNEPGSIGTMASLGCLRLLPDDIAEFAKFVPRGTEVEVR